MAKKYVYNFEEAYGLGKELLGGKGAGLAEMIHIGIPIPPGFTVSTEACTLYYESKKQIPDYVVKEIYDAVHRVEKQTGKNFGGKSNPLLVSVRSGARASMPGMMDTVLNLGLNDETVEILAKETNNPRFAYDSYRRFILMYTNIAKGHPRTEMDKMLEDLKEERGYKLDTEITADELKGLVDKFKAYYKKVFKEDFPKNPYEQLIESVTAVFRSWDNPRANVYRKMHNIPYEWGTAVNVQAMVFGNKNEESGTGVAFSRSPSTGEKTIFAEYLPNAQGEDVVAGTRTPLHIEELDARHPEVYKEFVETIERMEKHYHDMQDMEFTVEDGKLYFLQTRSGKRTAQAALKIASDLVDEGIIDIDEAVLRVDPNILDTLLHPSFDEKELAKLTPLSVGLPASPGAATGKLAFTAQEAKERFEAGEKVILIRVETSPEDIEGMVAAEGILTMRGGMTSHAAVVARGMGKTCVAGAGGIVIDEVNKTARVGNKVYTDQDVFSLNGTTGSVYAGEIKMQAAQMTGYFGRIMAWADERRRLEVHANAETERDVQTAKDFGAEGIGLARTEHMFFDKDRIFYMRKMILEDTVEGREEALASLLPYQRDDFYKIFKIMGKLNVTVRLLDPPLHEFLPQEEDQIVSLAKALNKTPADIKTRISDLHEFNPMMGHRGLRLAVSYPEIAKMQTTAIIEAAILAQKDLGEKITPEIMIPLTLDSKEFLYVKNIITSTADKIIKEANVKLDYLVGTMIEIPRATLLADEIAKDASFFSFGTNDLTQMTYGFSRDDAAKFLNDYYDKKIFAQDPFQTIDQKGVGELVKIAVERGREANPDLHLGVCGEHGGDPLSVEFFHNVGLDYVSCSPFRVPVARLAAAQAAIKEKLAKK